jgi:hypothetical protein
MGRPLGSPNKVTKDMKDTINKTFTTIGGAPAYAEWARANPSEFYAHWLRLLPKQIEAEINTNMIVAIKREYESPT